MTVQIAVRLPDDIVAFVDEQVTSGAAPSRAAVVARALQRDRRREAAERDARIYAGDTEPGDVRSGDRQPGDAEPGDRQAGDLDDLATWAASHPMDID